MGLGWCHTEKDAKISEVETSEIDIVCTRYSNSITVCSQGITSVKNVKK